MMQQTKRTIMLGVVLAVLAACGGAPAAPAANETTTVQRGNLTVTVSSSGTVQPERSANLAFGVTGTVQEVYVTEGQAVTQDQKLASLDARDLEQQVVQAEANLQTARARLEQAKSGNATEQDVVAQEAAVRGAEANLQRVRSGNITAADIANAQAAVRAAQANLDRARSGNITAADIANAEAGVRSAEAQLEAVRRGATPEQISAAQARLTQAQQSYQKTVAAASANKSAAEQSLLQAADAVRLAQNRYSSAYWDNERAQNGIDPKTGQKFEDLQLDADIQKQQYAEALRTAELQLRQAESQRDQAVVAFENAKKQEASDVATAQTQVDDAQVQLNELLNGPDATDVTRAQAAVDQARAQLQKLRQGGTAADVAAAQAQLDQARAQLQKLRQGGTAADVAAAQAQVEQSQAQLERLSSGAAPADVNIAEAGVSQAEAQLTAAKLNLAKATLRAPFDGIITNINISIGDSATGASATGAAITIVDSRKLHIDVSISESDVAQLREGQAAQVTVDALGTDVISGTVSYIAPAATVSQNVTTYLVRVDVPADNRAIRVGMTTSVDIGTNEKENVLIVPLSAVRSVGLQRFVRLKTGDTFTDREVRLGLSSDTEAEVVSGLNEGDVIATLGTAPTSTN